MKCPKCKNKDSKVVDSRSSDWWRVIRRRRECTKCESRFTTFEKFWFVNFFVIKSNWKKELYDRLKLENSILRACNKRDIKPELIEKMIDSLETNWASNKIWVKSKRIWSDVLNKLKQIDEIAYIRFASVYENFHSIRDFTRYINEKF